MINGGERGRKPSEKEEYKEGTMRRRKRQKEGRHIAMLLSHLLGRQGRIRLSSSSSPSLPGNGPRATVSGADGGGGGRGCAVIMRKEVGAPAMPARSSSTG